MWKYPLLQTLCFLVFITPLHAGHSPVARELKNEYFLTKANDSTLSISQRIVALDSLRALSREVQPDLELKRAKLAWEGDLHEEVVKSYERWLTSSGHKKEEDSNMALYRIAMSSYKQGQYENSAKYAYMLLKVPKATASSPYNLLAATILAKIYIRYNYDHKAANILTKWEKDLSAIDSQSGDELARMALYDWYNAETMLYILRKDYDKAFKSNQIASKYITTASNRYAVEINKAILYVNLNEPSYAKATLQNLLNSKPSGDYLCIAINNYADMLYNEGKYEEAANFLTSHLSAFDETRREHLKAMMYSLLADCLAHCGKYQEAYYFSEEYMKISQMLLSSQGERIAELTEDFERDLLQQSSFRLTEDNRKKSQTIIFMVGALAILVIAIAFAIWRITLKIKKNRNLETELTLIQDRHAQDQESLRKGLEEKGKALIANAVKMVHLQGFYQSIEAILESKANSEDKISSLKKELKKMNIDNQIWEMFDKYFADTHPAFFQKLLQAHPDLTQAETRMCAFMIMNLNGKEIAQLTNRSIRTVDVIKYRLRKKLNIEEPTVNYLLKFV